MDRITTRLAVAAAAGLALLAAGCSGHAAAAAGTNASPAGATSPALPSPFTIAARYTAASLGLSHPDALAIGPDGNLYVTDLSQRVTVISPAGTVLRRWGKPGTSPGQFRFAPGTTYSLLRSPVFGPHGEVFTLATDGTILKFHVTLPGA